VEKKKVMGKKKVKKKKKIMGTKKKVVVKKKRSTSLTVKSDDSDEFADIRKQFDENKIVLTDDFDLAQDNDHFELLSKEIFPLMKTDDIDLVLDNDHFEILSKKIFQLIVEHKDDYGVEIGKEALKKAIKSYRWKGIEENAQEVYEKLMDNENREGDVFRKAVLRHIISNDEELIKNILKSKKKVLEEIIEERKKEVSKQRKIEDVMKDLNNQEDGFASDLIPLLSKQVENKEKEAEAFMVPKEAELVLGYRCIADVVEGVHNLKAALLVAENRVQYLYGLYDFAVKGTRGGIKPSDIAADVIRALADLQDVDEITDDHLVAIKKHLKKKHLMFEDDDIKEMYSKLYPKKGHTKQEETAMTIMTRRVRSMRDAIKNAYNRKRMFTGIVSRLKKPDTMESNEFIKWKEIFRTIASTFPNHIPFGFQVGEGEYAQARLQNLLTGLTHLKKKDELEEMVLLLLDDESKVEKERKAFDQVFKLVATSKTTFDKMLLDPFVGIAEAEKERREQFKNLPKNEVTKEVKKFNEEFGRIINEFWKCSENLIQRVTAIKDLGGTTSDIEVCLRHLPKPFWPPELNAKLYYWRKVEREIVWASVTTKDAKEKGKKEKFLGKVDDKLKIANDLLKPSSVANAGMDVAQLDKEKYKLFQKSVEGKEFGGILTSLKSIFKMVQLVRDLCKTTADGKWTGK
jgi:hypothetical protein